MIEVGLLWYDDSPGLTFVEKIKRAASRHKQKYGVVADFCYVHSAVFDSAKEVTSLRVGDIFVAPLPTVLRHHFWIGVSLEVKRAKG